MRHFIPHFSDNEISRVTNKLKPTNNRACNNNVLWNNGEGPFSGDFYGHSLKRSHLEKCIFTDTQIDHTSFTGSSFKDVTFLSNCKIESGYFEQSTFSNVVFSSGLNITNSNFSNSYLFHCSFLDSQIRGTYFSNSYINHTYFENCIIRATMFDGSRITNTTFKNCNMRNLNIEFASVDNCDFSGSTISYFQIPYIIGLFNSTNNISTLNAGIHGDYIMGLDEYMQQIQDSIIYFTSLDEYFPLVSLYYQKGNNENAYNCLIHGIDVAIQRKDIRMIENFCALGQAYNLLSISELKDVLERVDSTIETLRDDKEYGMLLTRSYHLKSSINQNRNQSKLEITINTNVPEKKMDIISEFCSEIDLIINMFMPNKIKTSFEISHNSPFEICVNCIGMTADLIAISGLLYGYILKRYRGKKNPNNDIKAYIENSNKIFISTLNNQIDDLKMLLVHTKKAEHTEIVEKFRGKLIENVSSYINKDFALIVSQYEK